jgi:hypothetical protein
MSRLTYQCSDVASHDDYDIIWIVKSCSLVVRNHFTRTFAFHNHSGRGSAIPWRWTQKVPTKYWCLSTRPYSVMFQKTVMLIFTVVRALNLI